MPRIPSGEGFGNVVARGPGATSAGPEAAYGGAVAQTVAGIGAQMVHQERREAEQEQARQKALREAADKAAALQTIGRAEADLFDASEALADKVLRGEVERDAASEEWKSLSQSVASGALDGAPVEHRSAIQGQLELNARRVGRKVSQAVETRSRELVKAGLGGYLEGQARLAATNPEAAKAAAQTAIAQLGPAAGYGPDDVQRLSTKFLEDVAANSGSRALREAGDSIKAIDKFVERLGGDEFADLDPARRERFENQALARRSALETREQTRIARAEALAARRDRKAEAAFKTMQTFVDSGAVPNDAFVAEMSTAVSGTAYAAGFKQLMSQSADRSGFATLSPEQQRQKLADLKARAATGSDPDQQAQIARYERIIETSNKQLDENPLAYGEMRGLIDTVRPLQFTNVGELVGQLSARTEQAGIVSARTGRPVSPLTAGEATSLGGMLQTLPVEQRTAAVRTLSQTMEPRQAQALARQISQKDPTLAQAFYLANVKGQPRDVAALVMAGNEAIKVGRIKPASADATARDAHERIARQVDAVPWPTTQARDAAIAGAQAAYDGLRAENRASIQDAISLGMGGLTEWNDSAVPLPPGMSAREFRRSMLKLDAKKVEQQAGGAQVFVGGQPMDVAKLVSNMGAVRLIPAGTGAYALESGGQLVQTSRGVPLRIKVGD